MKKILTLLFVLFTINLFGQNWIPSTPLWIKDYDLFYDIEYMFDTDKTTYAKTDNDLFNTNDTAYIYIEFDDFKFIDRVMYTVFMDESIMNLYFYNIDNDNYDLLFSHNVWSNTFYDSINKLNVYTKKIKLEFIGTCEFSSTRIYDLRFSETELLINEILQPDQTICEKGLLNIEINCTYQGEILPHGWFQYQWYKQPLIKLEGETNFNYEKNGVNNSDDGNYYCVVSNVYDEIWSEPVNVDVLTTEWYFEEGYNDTIIENNSNKLYKIKENENSIITWTIPQGIEYEENGIEVDVHWDFDILNDTIVQIKVREFLPCGYLTQKSLNIKILKTVGINEYKNNIKVYPNPVKSDLTIENSGLTHYILFDINGKLINTYNFYDKEVIDLSYLSKGVYFYKIENKFGKIIKQ